MKYTIIYSVYVGGDNYLPQMDRIETESLQEAVDKYDDPQFIFERWPRLEGENNENSNSFYIF